jgi:hypothetical protein
VEDIADLGCKWSVFAWEGVNANVCQELLRQHVFLQIQKMYPDGKYAFWQISAPVYSARTAQQLFAEFRTPVGLATIFDGLEPAGLCYLARFAGESLGDA